MTSPRATVIVARISVNSQTHVEPDVPATNSWKRDLTSRLIPSVELRALALPCPVRRSDPAGDSAPGQVA
jgi:hypothetical protein